MRFASAISTEFEIERGCRDAAGQCRDQLGGDADFAVVFVSPDMHGDLQRIGRIISDLLRPSGLVGCTGGGVIGNGREVEGRPALSVVAACMPGVELHARHLDADSLPDADAAPAHWHRLLGVGPEQARGFVLLPEPFSFPLGALLAGLDFAYPGVPKFGGIASGGERSRSNPLFLGAQVHDAGAVVLGLTGDVVVETLVAQGCKPFGRAGRITSAQETLLQAIEGKPTMRFLQEQLENLDAGELQLARENPLFLGIALDPFTVEEPGLGDYLIRNVTGFDPKSGCVRIGELLPVGRLVQFHLRDRHTSHHELRELLLQSRDSQRTHPAGALLFSCLGRGRTLYGEEGHDSRLFREVLGEVPIGGFFCNGEIGPVAGVTYVHGYTSSFGLFRARSSA
jgi:small ligand-binding sensory domain FIST